MKRSDQRRFDAKVGKTGPVVAGMGTRCWEWTGAVDAAGYPKFWLGGNAVTAQRASYLLSGVKLHPGQQVISVCGNRRCVRPDHLVLGTIEEAHALRSRGRCPLGPGERWAIRKAINDGEATVEQVAEACGLRRELVEQIAASR